MADQESESNPSKSIVNQFKDLCQRGNDSDSKVDVPATSSSSLEMMSESDACSKKQQADKLLRQSILSSSQSTRGTKKSTNNNLLGSAKVTASSTVKKNDNCLLLAIVEGRGHAAGEVGMASIDLKRPELELNQFSDSSGYSRTLTMLYIKNPAEIIFPHTMCENGTKTKLFQLVSDHMKHCSITTINRRYYNDSNGKEVLQNLCHSDFMSVIYECREKYYTLSTCAALIKYVEFIQNMVFAPASMKIVFGGSNKTMMMDLATVRNLELVENTRDLSESGSLLNAMNFTKTLGGYRLLRVNILQPPFDLPTIISRQDCVEEITANPKLLFALHSQISRFVSLDHLLSLCIQLPRQQTVRSAENTITQVIALKHVMQLVPILLETLRPCKTPMLCEYRQLMMDARYEEILSIINVVVHEDVHFDRGILQMRTQKLFAIKDGINVILDVARRSYSEQIEVLRDEVNNLANEFKLPLRVAYTNMRGFFLQASKNCLKSCNEKLPETFIKVNFNRNQFYCTTEKIIRLNERLKDALSEIYLTAELVLSQLIKTVRVHMGVLYRLSEMVATLDLLLSFVHLSKSYNYVRPEFTNTLALKNAINPLHQRLTQKETVSNHVFASPSLNFTVITGANMSGKSMYLRQIALIQIEAQIGCFVPAVYASLRLTDHIFTRIGVDDDIQSNSSTFTIEMREISYIIHSLTPSSLVIIDELGRGTSADDGMSICFAVCENLLAREAYTFIASHFMEISLLEDMYPNVTNIHFEVQQILHNTQNYQTRNLNFTYKCIQGRCSITPDGMQIARVSSLPKELIEDAESILKDLKKFDPKANHPLEVEESSNKSNSLRLMNKAFEKLQLVCTGVYQISDDTRLFLRFLQSECRDILESMVD